MKVFASIFPFSSRVHPVACVPVLKRNQPQAILKRWLSLNFLVILILTSLASKAQVTLPHLDAINYTAGVGLQAQTGWTVLNSGDDLLVAAGNLSYAGLPASTGNKVTFSGAGIDGAKLFTQQTSGTVYYSFLLNVTALGSLNTTGGYFTGFTEGTTNTFGATVWTRSDGAGYDIGINPKTTVANTVWSAGTTAINTTILVVVSYQMVSGTLNDVVKLWINPTPGSAEPAATLSATNTVVADLANINRILIRQDATTATPSIEMDELRIGTTWASVTPPGNPPVVTPASPTGNVGASFTYNIVASNGPISSYNIASGTLPAGLSLNTGTGAITGIPTTAGSSSVDVTATNAAGTGAAATLSFTISPGSQILTGLPATDNSRTYGDAPYNLSVVSNGGGANSGNAITYSSFPAGVVTFSGNQVTIIGAGSTTITASQTGDANWNAASDITQSLTVNKATQTILFGALTNRDDVDGNFQLTATGGASGNPITYTSSLTSVAEIVNSGGTIDPNGDWVDIIAAGSTTITASQAGDANYLSATPVSQVQVINSTSLLPQTITGLAATDTRTYGDADYQLTATGGASGNPVTYQSLNTSVATIVDNLGNLDPNGTYIHILSNGVATIRASQAGNGTYNPAPDVDQVLTVNQKELTVSGAVVDTKPYDGTNAATISGYTVNGVVPGDNVTISGGGTFADVNAGTWAVTSALAKSGPDHTKYFLTQPTGLSGTITQLSQTIVFGTLAAKTFGNADFALTATGGASGNPVTYTSSDPAVATIVDNLGVVDPNGTFVHIVGAGSTIITASQAGNTNYSAALDVQQTQLVNQATQTITFAALANKTTADAPFNLTAVSNSGATPTGLTITYTSSNPAVADVVGNVVTIYGRGTTDITASQAGNTNYLAATSVTRTLIVTAPLIAAWDFTGPGNVATFAATTYSTNLGSSNLITRGATAAASAGANSFRTTGFKNDGIAVSNTDYFQVTLEPVAGKTLSLSDVTAKFAGTNTFYALPGVTSQFAYSLNGTTFTLIGSPVTNGSASTVTSFTMTPLDLTAVPALQNIPAGTTVTIRYYATGQTATGGWGFFSSPAGDNGLAFGGTIDNVVCAVTGTATTTAVCSGNTDGTATITLAGTGSGAPGTYSLDGGPAVAYTSNPFTITNLSGGAHTVVATVTAGGCVSSVINADVTINPLPTVSFSGLAATYCSTDAAVTLTGSPAGGTFSGTGIVGNTFDPSVAGAGGPYTITYAYTDPGTGCSNTSTQQVTVTVCATGVTVNLKLWLQGYYQAGGSMQPVMLNEGAGADPLVTDNITIELHDPVTYVFVEAQTVPLSTTGMASATFTSAPGSYYVAVKHRNSIQTWTANPENCTAATPLYDFTTASTQAYTDVTPGANPAQALVETGVWAIYSGDITQDDYIDGNDFPQYDTESASGGLFDGTYTPTDMNGDGFIDGNDFPVYDGNSSIGVVAFYPQ